MEKNKEVKYGCYVEADANSNDEWLPDCELDGKDITACSVAVELHSQGKTKEDCEFWRRITYATAQEITCPKCGYIIATPSEELIERARQLIKDLIKFVGE